MNKFFACIFIACCSAFVLCPLYAAEDNAPVASAEDNTAVSPVENVPQAPAKDESEKGESDKQVVNANNSDAGVAQTVEEKKADTTQGNSMDNVDNLKMLVSDLSQILNNLKNAAGNIEFALKTLTDKGTLQFFTDGERIFAFAGKGSQQLQETRAR